MINASGNQIINQWETIGMKYLTLNWSESPNQILFDPNDELADKILFFIEDSIVIKGDPERCYQEGDTIYIESDDIKFE